MSHALPIWALIALAFVTANLPFVNERVLTIGPRLRGGKAFAVRLLEWAVWYGVVGAVGMAMERAIGQNQSQGWEFYAITLALFLTFAFPGFVYRYLMHARRS